MQKILFSAGLVVFFVFIAGPAGAYIIEELNFSNEGDIVVGPGKTEVLLDPGSEYTKEIIVSNRSGENKIIDISVEDFQGSSSQDSTIKFLGKDNGPYSLKDYVKPEINQIILSHGQRLRLPVLISIPETVAPGGLYGAVMVSASNVEEKVEQEPEVATGKLKVITRVASLFFVRIKGDIFYEGRLQSFGTDKNFYEKGPVSFKIILENTGSVHFSPYGIIDIKNILGNNVGRIEIDPWFVMPNSIRTREIKWNSNFLFGRYTASLTLNKGYENTLDVVNFSFWIIPWKIISIILIALILIVWLFIWITSHFELKKKKSDNFSAPKNPPASSPPMPPMPPISN